MHDTAHVNDKHENDGQAGVMTELDVQECFIKLMPRDALGNTTKYYYSSCCTSDSNVHSTVTSVNSSRICNTHARCDTCTCGNSRNQLNIITTLFWDSAIWESGKKIALRCDDCRALKAATLGIFAVAGVVLTGGILAHAIAASAAASASVGAGTAAASGGAAIASANSNAGNSQMMNHAATHGLQHVAKHFISQTNTER